MRMGMPGVLLAGLAMSIALVGCSRESPDDPFVVKEARVHMVQRLIDGGRVTHRRVLTTMRGVHRHKLLPEASWQFAYRDQALALDAQHTLASPLLGALVLNEMNPMSQHSVLIMAPQTLYEAAVASRLCRQVVVIIHSYDEAGFRRQIEELGIRDVELHVCDVAQGWSNEAPYDAIMVGYQASKIPDKIVEQLAEDGVIVRFAGPYARSITVMRLRAGELTMVKTVAAE